MDHNWTEQNQLLIGGFDSAKSAVQSYIQNLIDAVATAQRLAVSRQPLALPPETRIYEKPGPNGRLVSFGVGEERF